MNNEFNIGVFIANRSVQARIFDTIDNKIVQKNAGQIVKGFYFEPPMHLEELGKKIKALHRVDVFNFGTVGVESGEYELGHPGSPITPDKVPFGFHDQNTALMIGVTGTIKDALSMLPGVIPGFADAEKLAISSLFNGLCRDGVLVKDSTSNYICIVAKNGTDISRFILVLFKRLWLAGHGYIKTSASGTMLPCTIIDPSISSPKRFFFKDFMTKKREAPHYSPGGMIDTSLLVDLTPDEETEYERLVEEAKALHKPDAGKIANDHDRYERCCR